MKMRPGTQTGFLMCGKEWIDGESFEVRSPPAPTPAKP
jgi:hypothetical protein